MIIRLCQNRNFRYRPTAVVARLDWVSRKRAFNVNDERPGNSKRSALLNGPLDCVVGRTSQKVQEAHYQVEKTNYQDRRSGPTVPLGLHQHGPRHHK